MRTIFNELCRYLPEFNYNMIPLIYISNESRNIRVLYNIDKRKQVMYSSTISSTDYRYMSIFEMFNEGWEIISDDEAFYISQGIEASLDNDLPI